MMTSLPSSPAPRSMTLVALGERGVPMRKGASQDEGIRGKTQTSPDVRGAQDPAIRHGDRGAGLLGLGPFSPTTPSGLKPRALGARTCFRGGAHARNPRSRQSLSTAVHRPERHPPGWASRIVPPL